MGIPQWFVLRTRKDLINTLREGGSCYAPEDIVSTLGKSTDLKNVIM